MAAKIEALKGLKKKKIVSAQDRLSLLDGEWSIIVDSPETYISRITLNNPEWENRMNNRMRAQLYEQLQLNDQNPDVRVTIIRGAGNSFCAGYEQAISSDENLPNPMFSENSDGEFQRNTLQGWFMIMDLAKPVIAQVHGKCLSAGSELASACDLVYVTPSAEIGYPEIRNYGLPDTNMYPWLTGMRNALSILLLAENMDGKTAVQRGWATGVFPDESIEKDVIEKARRVAKIPSDLLALNKRSVHRAFEAQGMRTNLRHGTDLEALMWHSQSAQILKHAETLYLRNAQSTQRFAKQTPAASPPAQTLPNKPVTKQPTQSVSSKAKAPVAVPRPLQPKTVELKSQAGRTQNVTSASSTTNEKREENVEALANNANQTDGSKSMFSGTSPSVTKNMPSGLTTAPVNSISEPSGSSGGLFIHINKPIAIHIHNEEKHSKL